MIQHPILSHLARFGVRLGLERMKRFLRHMGDPHLKFPCVHIAGTNGKGSVASILSEVLRAQGYRVGLYTSPHLQRVNERIRIDGAEIADRALDQILRDLDEARVEIAPFLEAHGQPADPLTYFEMTTAAAFVYFARNNIDIAILEVGLGGRLDATNVVDGLVSAVVSIGLDHTEQLGPDVASVAGEKAGIFSPGRPAVVGPVPQDALRVLRAIAQDNDVPLSVYGQDFHVRGDGRTFSWTGPDSVLQDLFIGLEGAHQVDNAAVALAVLDQMPPAFSVDPAIIRKSLEQVRVPGRMEWLAPDLLVDCAHNPDGCVALATYLRRRQRRVSRSLLLGSSREKDLRQMASVLAPQVDRVLTTACAHPRALPPGEVASALEGLTVPVMPVGPIEEALRFARNAGDEVIVAGSVFLAGAVRDLVGRQ